MFDKDEEHENPDAAVDETTLLDGLHDGAVDEDEEAETSEGDGYNEFGEPIEKDE